MSFSQFVARARCVVYIIRACGSGNVAKQASTGVGCRGFRVCERCFCTAIMYSRNFVAKQARKWSRSWCQGCGIHLLHDGSWSKKVLSNRYRLSRSRCRGCEMCHHNSTGSESCRLNRHGLSRAGCRNAKAVFFVA